MPPPPAKRHKRHIVQSSDEDEDTASFTQDQQAECPSDKDKTSLHSLKLNGGGNSNRSLPTRSRPRPEAPTKSSTLISAEATLSPSLEKPAKKTRIPTKEQKSRSLYTFFNAATQTQRANGRHEPEIPAVDVEDEDFIQDDSLDEDLRQLPDIEGKEDDVLDRRKRPRKTPPSTGLRAAVGGLQSASQRFMQKGKSSSIAGGKYGTDAVGKDLRPWAEKYAPQDLEELAVHKKKVADVRGWLESVLGGRDPRRLLILKGPSGAGKTATISTLAKTVGFQISEWRNPIGSEFSSEGFLSMSAQFDDFLGRSGKFGSLSFDCDGPGPANVQRPPNDFGSQSIGKRVILLEEFPNTFTRTSSALQTFRSSILQYLAANTPSGGPFISTRSEPYKNVTPVIMIISETLLTSTTASADSFTAHRLLGHEILNNPGTSVIEFNPIAATFLGKALDLVIQKEARQSGRRRAPGPAVLKSLGEIGDVRSAIGSLEFLCVKGDDNSEWSGRIAAKSKKGSKIAIAMTKMERESMEMVTQREATLGIFHAAGKVVYNKREEVAASAPSMAPPPQPPDHLSQHVRLQVSQVDVNQLVDETGTDTPTFVAALHENYVLSCDDPSSTDVINDCIDALSDSDLLSPSRGRGNHQGAAADSLRQDEICFQVAVRGILFALPNPVKRQAVPSVRGGKLASKADAFKMFYPASMRLWKQTEEIASLVDAWVDHSMRAAATRSDNRSRTHRAADGGPNPRD
ncbi:MAG: hypothetical protein LQ347_003287, partial [Umbilicaria vellea]